MLKKENIKMRGSKDEERWISPMFPKLNISDTEKLAPLRNKMALYEQFTIPSQKFRSGNTKSSSVSSTSSRHCKDVFEKQKSSPKVEKISHEVDLQKHVLTPDNVVKVLGEKQFWRVRKAMVDQQKTFRLQVFELHRLLKVQKLIARSPDLLLQDNIYSRKTLPKSSKQANHESHLRSSQWWVQLPQNQWLVPVISPSEGLVYKPYTAPCHHPDTGYTSEICGPLDLTSTRGDFLNAVYGVPASHQQAISGYVMPVLTSGSTIDQGSCNISSQISQTIESSVGNFQASKETEISGPKEYTLPLFPTEPTSRSIDQNAQANEKLTHVIKVVPHKRKLAPQSAARIFQSITEERNQCC